MIAKVYADELYLEPDSPLRGNEDELLKRLADEYELIGCGYHASDNRILYVRIRLVPHLGGYVTANKT